MKNEEIVEGYMDGLSSRLDDLADGTNRSESYKHGWRNGRDDRMQKPRAAASTLRNEAADIAQREASYMD
ncbi:hypothetical protein G6L37_06950 [Agrobacterium rubi]|nr:hypothetical protein [Agrobacterium rubi]NTF25103.1 hypothetical protein [Agrobacterium rubi]